MYENRHEHLLSNGKVLHIQRLLVEKLGRVPTLDELSQECGFDSAQVNKILSAADGFGCT